MPGVSADFVCVAPDSQGTDTAGNNTTNGYNSINIQETGIVTENWFGVSVAGLRSSVFNDGAIYAVGEGIYSLGGDSTFVNTGSISSGTNAIRLEGSWLGNILGTMNYVENSGALMTPSTLVAAAIRPRVAMARIAD